MPTPVAAAAGIASRRAVDVRGTSAWALETGLLVLLVGELIALSMAFDTWRVDAVPSAWARVVAWSPEIARLALAITVVALALDWRRVVAALSRATRPTVRQRVAAFAAHALAVAIFAVATSTLVNGDVLTLAHRPAWTVAWALSGLAALISWALSLFPAREWTGSLSPRGWPMVLGIVTGTAVWAFGFVTQAFWAPLARITLALVAWLLGLFYTDVVADPARLRVGTSAFKVQIDAACSGYEGVGLIVAFLGIYLWMFRRELRFPVALWLLPLGALTMWATNLVRIVSLIAIGSAGWPAIAIGGFHSQAGWIAFLTISLGFIALTSRARAFSTDAVREAPHAREASSTIALLAPFAAITATAMITGAFSAGFDWLYPIRVGVAGAVLWRFRAEYTKFAVSWSWWPVVIGVVVAALWVVLMPSAVPESDGWPSRLSGIPLGLAAIWVAFRTIGYVVMAPLAEELAFRAFLTRRLQRVDIEQVALGRFTWFSFLASSVLFGAFHGQLWLIGTLAGMAFALALYRRGAVADAVVAHAVTNGALAVYAAVTGQWSVWS